MDYSFYSRILLADAHSKHILITLVIDSQNFRNLQEFERDENRIEKIQKPTDKKVELQQDEHFEASEFHIMGWGYCK